MSTKTEIIKDVKTEKDEANEEHNEVVQMSEGYSPAYGTCSLSSNNVLPTEQKHKGSLSYMQDEKIFQERNIIINLQNAKSSSNFSNKVSVIKKNPLRSHQEVFPASFMNNIIKKHESIKDWSPYRQKLSLPGFLHLTSALKK